MPEIKIDELAGEEGGMESQRMAKFWLSQIERMGKDKKYMQFIKRGMKVEARYRDERTRNDEDERRRYNSLWSNVEILKPAVYGRTPVPVAERRFLDKDPVARGAAQILERALRNEVEVCGFHEAMDQAVSDYLLPGRGTLWVRYEPEFSAGVSLHGENAIEMKDSQGMLESGLQGEEGVEGEEGEGEESPDQTGEKLEETNDEIVRESTPVDYINWQDFLVFPVSARTWSEVVAVGKRVYMTYAQMAERFGKAQAKKVPLQKDERLKYRYENTTIEHEVKGEVFEIWNKQDRCVYWVAEGYEYVLDKKEDPLNLEQFFPTPRPLISNQTTSTLIPVADYIEYQDQATQIDELSQRIAMLTRACKVTGVYNAANRGIRRMMDESVENELIPVDDWSAFAERGGVEGQVSFMPLKEVIGVINELSTLKQQQIEEMDRLTGINDLMRGTNDARETLGGVRLKSNYTGTRLTARQNEVARFARDVIRIMADIMCQHFSPQSLVEVSGALYEEGLGVSVDQAQQQSPAEQPPPPGSQPMAGSQPALPPPQASVGGPQPGQPPQFPQGGNVVPMRPSPAPLPPGVGPQPGMGAPPSPIQAPPVAPGLPALPPPDPMQLAVSQAIQRIDQAIGLLRNERMRGFRVDIEVDSTIFADAVQEKQDRNEFVATTTKYLETSIQMAQMVPEITPLLGKLLQFGVRGYRIGRDLEGTIEEFFDQAQKIAKAAQQKAASQPNPEIIKAQAQAQAAQAGAESAKVRAQADVQKSASDIQANALKGQADQTKAAAELQNNQQQAVLDQQNNQADMMMKEMDVRMRQMEMQIEQMRVQAEMKSAQATVEAAEHGGQSEMHQATVQSQAQVHQANAEVEKTRIMADKPEAFKTPAAPAKPSSGAKSAQGAS